MAEHNVNKNILKLNIPYLKAREDPTITGEIDAINVLNLIAIHIDFTNLSIKVTEGIF